MHPAAELFPLPTRQAVVASGATFPNGRNDSRECVVVCLIRHLTGRTQHGWDERHALEAITAAGVPLPAGWSRELATGVLWRLMAVNDRGHLGTREAVAAALGVPLPAADPEAAAAVAAAEALVAGHAREVAPGACPARVA